MATIAGVIATAALSHLGGHLTGGILARFGLLGFGRKIGIARRVLKVGRALRAVFLGNPTPKAREDLQRWLQEHDPKNETRLGDGVV